MTELLSPAALACPEWPTFEFSGFVLGLMFGFFVGFIIRDLCKS